LSEESALRKPKSQLGQLLLETSETLSPMTDLFSEKLAFLMTESARIVFHAKDRAVSPMQKGRIKFVNQRLPFSSSWQVSKYAGKS
jgi:hypothetical protein